MCSTWRSVAIGIALAAVAFAQPIPPPSGGGFTLTTNGSSGAATKVGSVLNIPIYTGGGGGLLPTMTTTSNTVLTLNAAASRYVIDGDNNAAYAFTAASPITLTAGSPAATGTVYICFNAGTGQLKLYAPSAFSTNGNSLAVGGDLASHLSTGTSCGTNELQLYANTMTSPGVWDAQASSMSFLPSANAKTPVSGDGTTLSCSGGVCSVVLGGTVGGPAQTIASGTSALGTSAIASGACATVVTTAATNVLSTDAISWNPNASIKAVTGYVPASTGGLSIAGYPTSGNVNWDVCNWSNASITPGAVTLNWRVIR